jgi:xanthine dehydrogenase accessory factor
MNHWKESAEIFSRLSALVTAGQRAALATVVRIAGSAYRRPGAKLLIEADGASTLGSVSGGCLEADVYEVAKAVLATGQPWLRHYDTAGESIVWGLGLGCNGQVDVFVQPATAGPLAGLAGRLRQLFSGDAAFVLVSLLDSQPADGQPAADPHLATGAAAAPAGGMMLIEPGGAVSGSLGDPDLDLLAAERARGLLSSGRSEVHELLDRQLFFEAMPPPPHLVVCGAGDDARPLVAYAADVGFRVTVVDHRPALLNPAWFPQAVRLVEARPEEPEIALPPAARSLAVVKTHSLAQDRGWVRRLLAAGLPYVGVLGPRARTAGILRDLESAAPGEGPALAPGAAERVFGPVGLDLGADGPRQVAVAIVAELLAFLAQREPLHLSARREAIHAV